MRVLALNLGNTSLFAGLFSSGRLVRRLRLPTREAVTAQGFATLVGKLARRGRRGAAPAFAAIALGSVVPAHTAALARRLTRAYGLAPRLLTAAAPHGLRLGYYRPPELGTDRLAAALGARARFPGQNVLVIDCGTAATLTALRADGLLAGGAILPGLALWAEALATRTAQLPHLVARRPRAALGRSPAEAIASGLYYGHLGALSALTQQIAREAFGTAPYLVVGTGGGAPLFRRESLFTHYEPHLVLLGLHAFAAGGT